MTILELLESQIENHTTAIRVMCDNKSYKGTPLQTYTHEDEQYLQMQLAVDLSYVALAVERIDSAIEI